MVTNADQLPRELREQHEERQMKTFCELQQRQKQEFTTMQEQQQQQLFELHQKMRELSKQQLQQQQDLQWRFLYEQQWFWEHQLNQALLQQRRFRAQRETDELQRRGSRQ